MIIPFAKATDFVSFFLEDSRFQPRHIFDATERGVTGHVFRGQSDMSWSSRLLPSVFRPGDPLGDYTPQPPDRRILDHRDARFYLGLHLHEELRAVHMFLEQADKLGIPTPLDYRGLQQHQIVLDSAIQGLDYDWETPFPELSVIAGFALAQHHGIPTRLLDWTESPLVASYFAAFDASTLSQRRGQRPASEFAVLILRPGVIGRTDRVEMVSAPRHINTHLRAQRGVFVHMPKANKFFLEQGHWPSLGEELKTMVEGNGGLDAATLSSSQADELLRLLWRYEITRHHLMPSLTHAASAFAYARALFPSLSAWAQANTPRQPASDARKSS